MRLTNDLLGIALISPLALAFLLMAGGYAVLLRQALKSTDRQASLKRVWDWRGQEHLMDRSGLRLIFGGAVTGLLGIVLLLVLAATYRR